MGSGHGVAAHPVAQLSFRINPTPKPPQSTHRPRSPRTHTFHTIYDDLGRLTRQKLAEQTATLNDAGAFIGASQSGANWAESFVYDNRSNLTEKTDARGVRTFFSYQLPGGGDDPLNRIQRRSHNLAGPLEPNLAIHDAPIVDYFYMTAGDKQRISQIRTDGVLTEDFAYDGEGRVEHYTQKVDYRENYPMQTSYLYDTLDRVKEVTYPAQYGPNGGVRKIVASTYDTASRLTSLSYGTPTSMVQQAGGIVYDASDQTTQMVVGANEPNPVTETYTFDPQTGLLTNQTATRNGSQLLNLSYDYNRNNSVGTLNGKTGHLTKITDNLNNNKNREYEFDAVGRLTKAKGGVNGALSQQSYSYDRFGNRTNVTATGVAADNSPMPVDGIPNLPLAFDNANNRITTNGFQYDSAGNQTRALGEDGIWLKYEYDAANRIRVVKHDDGSPNGVGKQAFMYGSTNARLIDYDYGVGMNKLFSSVGGTTLAEYTEFTGAVPTWTKSYTYLGDSQLSTITPNGTNTETIEYDHPDRLGNKLKTNPTTGSVSEQAHLPFGRPLNAETSQSLTTNNKRFTSYDRSNATGLDYAVNRTYDSNQGRFTQVDPIGMQSVSISNPQTLNLYVYCANDPVNSVDPSGLGFFSFLKKLFRAVASILKWVAIVVLVAVIILSGPFAPASGSFLGKLLFDIAWLGAKLGMASNFLAGGVLLAEPQWRQQQPLVRSPL